MEKTKSLTADEVFTKITEKLSTVDGLALGDAFSLGSLIRQYGEAKAGEAIGQVMEPLLEKIGDDLKKLHPKEPWKD